MNLFHSSGEASSKKSGNFESLSSLDFIVFGNYSTGLPNQGIPSIEHSLKNFLELKRLISDCAKGSYKKYDNESDIGYDHRMDMIVREKVKGFLVCILPISWHNKLENLKERFLLSSIDLYDPSDRNLLSAERENAIAVSGYKYHGDFRLSCDAGARIPEEKLEQLIKIL